MPAELRLNNKNIFGVHVSISLAMIFIGRFILRESISHRKLSSRKFILGVRMGKCPKQQQQQQCMIQM